MKTIKSFCGCFTDRGGFFKKSPWPPEARNKKRIMVPDLLYDIIDLCYTLDKAAVTIYSDLSQFYSERENELSRFWGQMAKEEKEHVVFWEGLLPLAKKGMIPQLFEEPVKIKTQLEDIKNKTQELQKQIMSASLSNKGFLVAFRLEFYLLHPAFEMLFHFAQGLKELDDVVILEDEYEQHINDFIEALNRFDTVSPEMQLLGETLDRLWRGNTDPLTHILNRRGFFNALKPLAHFAQRNKYHVGILMIDIDNFKAINDAYGHQQGDYVLTEVARHIEASLRKSDICGRYGGEEFIVFLPSVGEGENCRLAEKIRTTLHKLKPAGISLTVSIGCTGGQIPVTADADQAVNELIKTADQLLYKAKALGKNQVIHKQNE
jgi:diguanylate cyclase (GGDEF)-like protein